MVRAQIEAIRAQAIATVAQCDALLRALGDVPAPPTGACTHPPSHRQPAPRMGLPDAYRCGLCGADVEG